MRTRKKYDEDAKEKKKREIKSKSNRTLKHAEWKEFCAMPGNTTAATTNRNWFSQENTKLIIISNTPYTYIFEPNGNFSVFFHLNMMVWPSSSPSRHRTIVKFAPTGRCCVIKLSRSLVSHHALTFGSWYCAQCDQKSRGIMLIFSHNSQDSTNVWWKRIRKFN